MRRQLRLVSLVAAVALLGTGCLTVGLEDTTDVGASEGTIRYALWDANQLPAYKKCADAFQAKNPKIQVKIEQRGWDDYWGNLTTTFVAGNAPDVITDHLQKYPEFVKTRQLAPLDEFIARDRVAPLEFSGGVERQFEPGLPGVARQGRPHADARRGDGGVAAPAREGRSSSSPPRSRAASCRRRSAGPGPGGGTPPPPPRG